MNFPAHRSGRRCLGVALIIAIGCLGVPAIAHAQPDPGRTGLVMVPVVIENPIQLSSPYAPAAVNSIVGNPGIRSQSAESLINHRMISSSPTGIVFASSASTPDRLAGGGSSALVYSLLTVFP